MRNKRSILIITLVSVHKYRITASFFGEIFKCLPTTPPHHLVLCIIDPKPFNCAATEWGKTHETCVFLRNIESTTKAEITLTWSYLMLALLSQSITHS